MENVTVRPNRSKAGRIITTVLLSLLIFVGFLGFFAARWYVQVYGRIGFDSVLFTLTGGLGGVSKTLIKDFLMKAGLPALMCTYAIAVTLFYTGEGELRIGKVRVYPLKRWLSGTLAAVLSLSLLVHAAFNVELVDYLFHTNQQSELYHDEYVDPDGVNIRFPSEKRNLVYIFLESMETSYLSKDLGGALDYNLIPELTQLAQENINFSNNDSVGGFRQVTGTSWTIGAMTAHTGGVPLKVPEGISDWQNGYGQDGEFLDGLTNLTSILHDEGYYQTLMVGSVCSFGGRQTFYENHGVDRIYDIYDGWDSDIMDYGYWNGWWGFEDMYLFECAKQELTEISQKGQPFALTMLTVDTHHIGGYKCELCGSNYEENYENVIACASKQVYNFIQWLQQQPYYENTTVIITGDHCSMDNGYFNRNVDDDYVRHIYNCFINAAAEPLSDTTNRQFCAMDMFPTTLAAMGCTIEGNRLGLGTNLFSSLPTLMERMGYNELCTELSKKSAYYSEHFYGKDYNIPATTE